MKKCSVIIPVYNGEKYLRETINSVLNQTYKNIEIVIIEDCSTDNSRQILSEFLENPKFKIIFNDYNLGLNTNIQKGINYATGDFICIIGQDDLYPSDKIETEITYLENTGKDVVYAAGMLINEQSKLLENSKPDCKEFVYLLNNDRNRLYEIICTAEPNHFLPMSQSALYKAEVLKELNTFRSSVTLDDWPILVKCFEKYNFGFLDKVMFYWRIHDKNNSKRIWWNLGISVQSLLETVPDKYKLEAMANNFYYTFNSFYNQKSFYNAFKMIAVSFILAPKKYKLKWLRKSFERAFIKNKKEKNVK